MAYVKQCPCGDEICTDWHVLPHAAVQGVHFTYEQAEIISAVLNGTAVVIMCDSAQAAENVKRSFAINGTPFGQRAILIEKETSQKE